MTGTVSRFPVLVKSKWMGNSKMGTGYEEKFEGKHCWATIAYDEFP